MRALPEPTSVRTVVVRMTNWVGDVVMNTPFLGECRRLFPNARIIALGRKNVTGLLDPHPFVDEAWTIEDKTLQGRREAARRLRAWKADVGFALPNSINAALLLFAGRVQHRVGYARDARTLLLSCPVKLRPQDLAVHEVKYYLRLLSPWNHSAEHPQLTLMVTEEEQRTMAEWLRTRGVGEGQCVIGINPAAFYGTAKRWLPERYAEAGRELAGRYDAKVFVTGLPSERDWAQRVVDAGGERFHNAAGEMKLRELMAFLSQCRLFLTNDSGAMHIAAALGVPQVAVFGSTDWVTTAPLSERARIVRVETECAPCLLRDCPIDHRCMDRVTSDMVVEEAEKLLVGGRS